jgi:hypothetical protein
MTAIYHITHIRNLPNILRDGGLWCDRVVMQRNLAHICISHQHIKDRRAQKPVPCAPGGMVADYVPFYFAPRSPMLYSIHHGYVQDYQGGQSAILHLVASAEEVVRKGLAFTFTEGHAVMDISHFYSRLGDLDKIDWDLMASRSWSDIIQDGDRKRRRQAEFLVHEFFPFTLFDSIGVINQTMSQKVTGLLQPLAKKPVVQVVQAWYY